MVKKVYVIIVAAGSGHRFGSDCPKQFHLLDGRPVLMHTIDAFRNTGAITVVISKEMETYWQELCEHHGFTSPRIVHGGDTRFHSVRNALCALQPEEDSLILVHDGARPLVAPAIITSVLQGLENNTAVVPGVPVTDSLRQLTDNGTSSEPVDRSLYVSVQTPQGFHARTLTQAYTAPFNPAFTDDASVVQAAGHSVAVVNGDSCNIKITNPTDLAVATALLHELPAEP